MAKPILVLLFLTSFLSLRAQQQPCIEGRVDMNGESLPYASIKIQGRGLGTVSDAQGHFQLCYDTTGPVELVIDYAGALEQVYKLNWATQDLGTISLQEDHLGLEEVVVTGSQLPTYRKRSTVKVDVVDQDYIQTFVPSTKSVVENTTLINGVQEVVACGVCYTNSISINGLPGQYTMVLVDGMPMYGNLSTVYGLNGIPNQMIQRMEVIKGPNSTLYGSEAIGGVINLITKTPEEQSNVALDIMGTTNGESFGNISFKEKFGKLNAYAGGNYAYAHGWDDNNQDGFNDMVNLGRVNGFAKFNYERPSVKPFSLAVQYNYEDRRNGLKEYLDDNRYRAIRGSNQIYGESIYTNRWAVFGTYGLNLPGEMRLDYSLTSHKQNAYYGADFYAAQQVTGFMNLVDTRQWGQHHLLSGLTLRYNDYDDNTVATELESEGELKNKPQLSYIPGLFVQDEWQTLEQLKLLGGFRLDYYTKHGLIPSPRLGAKYDFSPTTHLRFNSGTGFRVVNLFTEDHAFVTGQRKVILEEELNPEQAYNASLSLGHTYTMGSNLGELNLDVFYTHFENRIIADYDSDPQQIIYANLDGFSYTRGIAASVDQSFQSGLSVNLSTTLQQVERHEEGQISAIPYAPDYMITLNASYTHEPTRLTLGTNTRLTGPMAMPEVYDFKPDGSLSEEPRPLETDPFLLVNVMLTKKFEKWPIELYTGVSNLLNNLPAYSPLSGYQDPNAPPGFSDHFDTAYSGNPWHDREVLFGIRYQANWDGSSTP